MWFGKVCVCPIRKPVLGSPKAAMSGTARPAKPEHKVCEPAVAVRADWYAGRAKMLDLKKQS